MSETSATTERDIGSRTGVVQQINVSRGGVPKLPVPEAAITADGVAGDRQRNTRVHGGPNRAVCLFSADVIDRLRHEGHPIEPGGAGENVTVRGLDWSLVRPGARLRLGEAVLLEVTSYTAPCTNVAACFRDGDVSRILVTRAPGEARVYARVLAPGRVKPGDRVEMLVDDAAFAASSSS